jgi:HemY protein
LYAGVRAIATLRDLPGQAQRWRNQQIERAAVGSVMDAMAHQLSGRFVRAQAAAQEALDQMKSAGAAQQWRRRHQLKLLAHLLVAESAQSLRKPEQRDEHLQAALHPRLAAKAPEAYEGALLRAVRWAIEDRDPEAARARLAELPQGAARRIQALRLRLRVARLGGATGEALDTARLLAKHGAFTPEAAGSIVRGLALDALREAKDFAQLRKVWKGLDGNERNTPELAVAASLRAHRFLPSDAEQADPDSRALALQVRGWLMPFWSRFDALDGNLQAQFSLALEPVLEPMEADWLAQLEQAQRSVPNNPFLQYLAGQACMRMRLWGKAAQLLGQARHRLTDPTMLRRCWCSLAELAQERGDDAAASAAWKKAALLELPPSR